MKPMLGATPIDLVRFLLECGGRLQNRDAQAVLTYFETLLRRERVVTIKAPEGLVGFCTFFLLRRRQEIEAVYHRPPWTTPWDDRQGTLCFIDLIVALRWEKALRQQLEDVILWRFPQIREALWYRVIDDERPDRACRYRIQRERLHAPALHG